RPPMIRPASTASHLRRPALHPFPRRRVASHLQGLFVLAVCAFAQVPAFAAPSGGPYGPIPQSYAVPRTGNVHYVAPDADPAAAGATPASPTTIEAAITRVVTGDAI